MRDQLDVLVASSDVNHRKSLMDVLGNLPLNVICCSTVSQAEEVLSRQPLLLLFCDEYLGGGSYRDLLCLDRAGRRRTRTVVMIRTGEWDEYLDAMRLGAFDAVRCPLQPTDIELVVLRAMRESREALAFRMTA